MKSLILTAVSLWALSLPASAGENRLQITQEGVDNELAVDQSAATRSTVGGLVIDQTSETVYFQTGMRETDQVDEQGKPIFEPVYTGRPVGNLYASQADIASQAGIGNSATMTITGIDGWVGLLQETPSGSVDGNSATIEALGGSSAYVGQIGSNNTATLTASDKASGTILQSGHDNIGTVNVLGRGARAALSQIGDGNNNQLDVTAPNADVSYFVDGYGLSGLVPAEVSTSVSGPITIRQTAIGVSPLGAVTTLPSGVTVTQSGQ
ncbi:MAG: hypothetical protein VYD57_11315 [Pseudomonadota bacterium]|nr:hypothetical protein [Pseudomonadota bacterium]